MNLNTYIRNKLERLRDVEDVLINQGSLSKQMSEHFEYERKILLEIQLLMMKTLDQQYSCHGITYIPDMFEYYDFDIVVTPKSIKNE